MYKNEVFHPRTKILNEIISKGKFIGDKRDLGYLDESTTSSNGKTNFVNTKKIIPIIQKPTRIMTYVCLVIEMVTLVEGITLRRLNNFIAKLTSLWLSLGH